MVFLKGRTMRIKTSFLIVVFTVSTLLVVVAIWALMEPFYRVTIQIDVRRVIPDAITDSEYNDLFPIDDKFLKTQVSKIKSMDVIMSVVFDPDIRKRGLYTKSNSVLLSRLNRIAPSLTKMFVHSPADKLSRSLQVHLHPETNTIDISIVHKNVESAKTILEKVAYHYEYSARRAIYGKLVEKLNNLSTKIKQVSENDEAYRELNKTYIEMYVFSDLVKEENDLLRKMWLNPFIISDETCHDTKILFTGFILDLYFVLLLGIVLLRRKKDSSDHVEQLIS